MIIPLKTNVAVSSSTYFSISSVNLLKHAYYYGSCVCVLNSSVFLPLFSLKEKQKQNKAIVLKIRNCM